MRFVIVGAGRVGKRTARVLEQEDHDVHLIETNPEVVEKLRKEGYNVTEGSGDSEQSLLEAGVADADGLAGLSGDTMTNLVACLVAKSHGCRTVLRIGGDDDEVVFQKYADAVDETIYPERLGAIAAKNALMGGDVRAIADIAHDVQLVELTVTESAPMRGYTLSELELPADARLLGFGKAGEPIRLPDGDFSIELGDRLVVIVKFAELANVRQLIVGTGGPTVTA